MNLVETIKNVFQNGPYMELFKGMQVDYSSNANGNTGLFLSGDTFVSEDLIGNVTRRATFTAYWNIMNATDSKRLENSTLMLELEGYLESFRDSNIGFDYSIDGGKTKQQGVIQNIQCTNGMLFRYLNGNPSQGAQYMLQLAVDYQILS